MEYIKKNAIASQHPRQELAHSHIVRTKCVNDQQSKATPSKY